MSLEKVAGDHNPADAATKHLSVDRLKRCFTALGCEARPGRSDAAPALAAHVEPFLQELGGGKRSSTGPAAEAAATPGRRRPAPPTGAQPDHGHQGSARPPT